MVGEWEIVSIGHTGAVVRRSRDGRHYAKTVSDPHGCDELSDECERLHWLETTDVPAPRAVDYVEQYGAATLTTTAVPGIRATAVRGAEAPRATTALSCFLTGLHELPVESCPFDRRLEVTLDRARLRVEEGLVDEEDFDLVRLGRSAPDLFEELRAGRLFAEGLEEGDLVVCHGDATLDNVMLDPDTMEVNGILDVGRLGTADCHLDLALLTRSMSARHLNPAYGPGCATRLLAAYPVEADPWRLEYYRLLDELL